MWGPLCEGRGVGPLGLGMCDGGDRLGLEGPRRYHREFGSMEVETQPDGVG